MSRDVLRVLQSVMEVEAGVPRVPEASEGGFFTAQMIEERWEYRDFPRMDGDTWHTIRTMIEGQYKALTWARYPNGQCRGQVFVSPEGIRTMRNRCRELSN